MNTLKKKRNLGQTGFEVVPLAFGGDAFGWTINSAKCRRLPKPDSAGGNPHDRSLKLSRFASALGDRNSCYRWL